MLLLMRQRIGRSGTPQPRPIGQWRIRPASQISTTPMVLLMSFRSAERDGRVQKTNAGDGKYDRA
jgi:hypothetical protein